MGFEKISLAPISFHFCRVGKKNSRTRRTKRLNRVKSLSLEGKRKENQFVDIYKCKLGDYDMLADAERNLVSIRRLNKLPSVFFSILHTVREDI